MEPQKATSAATDVLSRQTVTLRKLSVIVLSYNTRETTIRCIRSLFKHAPTTAELETVVIDNASSDGSAEAIARLFPRIKLIRNAKNRGFAAACNQGIRSSDGDILLLLNSDTELTDQSLDIMLDFLERNSDVGIAGGAMIGPDGRHQTSCQHYPSYTNLLFSKQSLFMSFKAFRKKYSKYRRIPGAITDVDAVAGGFLFIRREALRKVGLLDERFFFYVEDVDLAKRMTDAGWRVVYVPAAKILHYGGKSTSLKPAKSYWWHHRSLYRYFKKHYGKYWLLNFFLGLGLLGHFVFWWIFSRSFGNGNGSEK